MTLAKWEENYKNYVADSPGRIAITTYLWTCKSDDNFLCITAHNIDAKWVINKRNITFSKLEWPHTGQIIVSLILERLQEFDILEKLIAVILDNHTGQIIVSLILERLQECNILEKLIAIILDNASNNKAAIDLIKL